MYLLPALSYAGPIVTYSTFGPDDHYSTKGGTNGFSMDIGQDYSRFDRHNRVANGFTLEGESTSLSLTSIELAIAKSRGDCCGHDDRIRISIFDDGNGLPGQLIEELLLPIAGRDIYRVDSLSQPSLLSNTLYWLVVESVRRNERHSWKWNGIAPFGTDTGPVLWSDIDQGTWIDRSGIGQQAFRVSAMASVPSPFSISLVILGLFGCMVARRSTRPPGARGQTP